jgi:hypothetical protein
VRDILTGPIIMTSEPCLTHLTLKCQICKRPMAFSMDVAMDILTMMFNGWPLPARLCLECCPIVNVAGRAETIVELAPLACCHCGSDH